MTDNNESITITTTSPITPKLDFESTCAVAKELYQGHANRLLEIYQRQAWSSSSSSDGNKNISKDDLEDDEDDGSSNGVIMPNEFVLITGPPGVGKTCLATLTLEEQTKLDGGYFCRGKFDQSASLSRYYQHHQVANMGLSQDQYHHLPNTYTAASMSHDSHHPLVAMITDLIHQIASITQGNEKEDDDHRSLTASLQHSLNESLDASELQALEASTPWLKTITRRRSSIGTSTTSHTSESASWSLPLFTESDDSNHHHHHEHWLLLKGPDAEKRHIQLFSKLFQAVRSSLCNHHQQHRIVLLLDDLQWADDHSLQLLRNMITTRPFTNATTRDGSDHSPLMILCTARMDEITSDDPLALVVGPPSFEPQNALSTLLADLKDHSQPYGVNVTELPLDNLPKTAVEQLVSTILNLPVKSQSSSLANMVYHQTEGNLFFVMQYLSVLEGEGHLQFCSTSKTKSWNENSSSILLQETFDNNQNEKPPSILSLLTKKMSQLNNAEQRILRVAACLGGTIYDCLLEERITFPGEEVRTTLCSLQQRHGLIKFDFAKGSGCFLHDRIQEAAYYSLIPKGQHDAVHLDLGRLLWKQLSPIHLETHLFTVVTQIQRGLHLLDDRVEKEDLSALFLRAGQKAMVVASFPAAATYLGVGIHLLGCKGWKYQYKRSLALHNAAAEVEYYNGQLARLDTLLAVIFDKAKSLDHKLRAHVTQIYSFGSRDDMKQALAKGLDVLKSLGVTFPRRPGKVNASFALGRCHRLLRTMSDDSIMGLPLMIDQRKLVVMRLLNTIYGYAFSNNETLVAMIATKMVETTLQHGISALSCVGFALLGFCAGHRGQPEQSYRLGRLALQILERFQAKEWQCRVALLVFGGVYSVKHPLKELVKPLQSAHRAGMVAGDINASLVCGSFQCRVGFYASEPLPYVVQRLDEYKRLCGYYGQMSVGMMLSPQLQVCFNLMGRAVDPLVLTGEAMDEKATVAFVLGKHPVALTWLLLSKHFLAVYLNDHKGAKSIADLLRKMKIGAVLPFVLHNHLFLEGLTAASLSRIEPRQIKRAKLILAKLKVLNERGEQNYENKIYLLEAEVAASNGERDQALSKYNQSIEVSRRLGFLHEQAMACEKAGCTYLRWGDLTRGRDYLTSAKTLYSQWGALAKVKQVDSLLRGLHLKM